MKTTYPKYQWDVYQFLQVPKGYKTRLQENTDLQKEFVHYLEKKFNIKQTNDWYGITSNQLKKLVSIDLITVMEIIKKFYPEIDLNNLRFGSNIKNNKNIVH